MSPRTWRLVSVIIVAFAPSISLASSCATSSNPTCGHDAAFNSICCDAPNICYYKDRSGTPGCCPYGQICLTSGSDTEVTALQQLTTTATEYATETQQVQSATVIAIQSTVTEEQPTTTQVQGTTVVAVPGTATETLYTTPSTTTTYLQVQSQTTTTYYYTSTTPTTYYYTTPLTTTGIQTIYTTAVVVVPAGSVVTQTTAVTEETTVVTGAAAGETTGGLIVINRAPTSSQADRILLFMGIVIAILFRG